MKVVQKVVLFISPSNSDLLRPHCGQARLWGLDCRWQTADKTQGLGSRLGLAGLRGALCLQSSDQPSASQWDGYSDLSGNLLLSQPPYSSPQAARGSLSNYKAEHLSCAQNLPPAGHLSSEPESGAQGAVPLPSPAVLPPLSTPAALPPAVSKVSSHSQLRASALAVPSTRNTLCPASQSILSPNGSEVPSSRGHPAHPIYDSPMSHNTVFSNMVGA